MKKIYDKPELLLIMLNTKDIMAFSNELPDEESPF